MHIIMATPLYNNNTDPIIIPDNLLFYHIPTASTVPCKYKALRVTSTTLSPPPVRNAYASRGTLKSLLRPCLLSLKSLYYSV